MVTTALVFAFLYISHTLPSEKLAARQLATAAHFAGRTVRGGHGFDTLVGRFRLMLGRGNLFTKKKWLDRCRLWRLILLQAEDGSWDPDDSGLGFALLAHHSRPRGGATGDGAQQGAAEAKAGLSAAVALMSGDDEMADDVLDDAAAAGTEAGEQGGGSRPENCPLTGYSAAALRWSVPEPLMLLQTAAGGEAVLPAARVWTTLLGAAALRRIDEHFLLQARPPAVPASLGNGVRVDCASQPHPPPLRRCRALQAVEGGAAADETVLDRAMAWLLASANGNRKLRAMLPQLEAEAQAHMAAWHARQTRAAEASRKAWLAQTFNRNALEGQRIRGFLATAARRGHETFSAVLAPPTGSLKRWQACLLVGTALMGMLVSSTPALPAATASNGQTRIASRNPSSTPPPCPRTDGGHLDVSESSVRLLCRGACRAVRPCAVPSGARHRAVPRLHRRLRGPASPVLFRGAQPV